GKRGESRGSRCAPYLGQRWSEEAAPRWPAGLGGYGGRWRHWELGRRLCGGGGGRGARRRGGRPTYRRGNAVELGGAWVEAGERCGAPLMAFWCRDVAAARFAAP